MRIYIINILKISHLSFIIFLFVSVCPSFGQAVNKKIVTEADYPLWSTLHNPIISNDGNWAAWTLRYSGIADSLMIINTETKETMKYKHAVEYQFSPNSKWIFNFESNRTLHLINLAKEETITFPDLELFYYSDNGNYAGVVDKNKLFSLINLETEITYRLKNVNWFEFSPDGSKIAISIDANGKNSIELIDTKTFKRSIILISNDSTFSNMVWNFESTALAFIEVVLNSNGKPTYTTLYEFRDGDEPELRSINSSWEKNFPANCYIDDKGEIFYADDGERIFFNIRPKKYLHRNLDSLKNNVQVWKGDDKWIVPRQLQNTDPVFGPWLALWKPKKNEFLQIANEDLPTAYLMPRENRAILFNPKQYEPNFKYSGDADIYLMDLKTKEKKLILEKQVNEYYNKFGSPNGDYLAYYKDKNWWVYDIEKEKHTNLSFKLPFEISTSDHHSSNAIWAYGFAGWDKNNKWVYIYDEFDIWKVAIDGKKYHRITQGREKNTTFRIYRKLFEQSPIQRFQKFTLDVVDIENGVVLEANSNNGSGYYTYSVKNGIQALFNKATKINNLKRAKEEGSYIVQEESYNIPKRIYLFDDRKQSLLFESNMHYKNFISPRQELINYKSFDGRDLKGILMYPDDYKEGNQYPMIVHIYERLSQKFHDYHTPTNFNSDGFNPKIYTAQGYFVLYPDIVYKLGAPGISALECVTTAVSTVLATSKVDKKRIGLHGHSFGGYEAAYIATQTDMFAAIVSSAGVSNFLSWYLTIGGYTGRENMWWFEEHQWRMGKSYFNDPKGYFRNSPINYVNNVSTPILLWSGAKDVHIDVGQNIEFYLALRRLGKKVTFLNYPNESHALTQLKNQIDATKRISDWFAIYLNP